MGKKPDWKREVMDVVDNEGFDYTFCDKDTFEEVKDSEFHKLREAYVQAAKALKEYIGYYDY